MTRRDVLLAGAVLAAVAAVAAVRTRTRRPAASLVGTGASSQAGPAHRRPERVPRMVDLGAGRCVPCREMAPILAELRSEYAGRAEVVFIDVWEQPDLAAGYAFRAIPTQIFFDRDGREAWRHEGFLGKPEIVARLRRLGVE